MFHVILLVVGFILLIKGADLLVDGASSIAKKFKISNFIIGLTVVAFGTSMPELVVSVLASIQGSASLAVGNILGSNVSNILLILGVAAFIYPLHIRKNTVRTEIPFSLAAIALLWLLINNLFLGGTTPYILTRVGGLILLLFFAVFLQYTFSLAKNSRNNSENIKQYPNLEAGLFILFGLIGLTWGGKLIVDSAVYMAHILGLSEFVIGVTVVAVGTSLPELATTIIAALKKHSDIAVGNVVGSNIFNILWILGISALIKPITFNPSNNIDIGFVFLSTFLLLPFMFIGKKDTLTRVEGSVFLFLYVGYIIFQIVRL